MGRTSLLQQHKSTKASSSVAKHIRDLNEGFGPVNMAVPHAPAQQKAEPWYHTKGHDARFDSAKGSSKPAAAPKGVRDLNEGIGAVNMAIPHSSNKPQA
eukprot:CAMPEP_0113678418 /NCGR_PEP_ID=MMETSP0038_2-20120614/9935_1 /TAXON_ID=2898 /ORGANISM="Cryptomonas paramecium" /LENGTH=98 /DNA_ID=CAMNT_0000596051 /DNA_START=84 /DNA_END=377 /DNA_ORIENTATION=- /assembly_acc=CAM_ASM_000170